MALYLGSGEKLKIIFQGGSYCANFYSGSPANQLITFTIDGTEYQAEDGMNWEEWVNSEYNTGGFVIGCSGCVDDGDEACLHDGSGIYYDSPIHDNNTNTQYKTTIIIANCTYTLSKMSTCLPPGWGEEEW